MKSLALRQQAAYRSAWMACPCCLGALTPPPWHPAVHAGDRFCPGCEWIFPSEILQWGDPLTEMGDVLRCPTHGEATQWVIRRPPGAGAPDLSAGLRRL